MAEDKEEEHLQTGTGASCHELVVYARRPRKRCQLYVPREMWFEILRKLPLISLLICQCVCRSWRVMVTCMRRKIVSLPLCGLLFPIVFKEPARKISYVCIRRKEVLAMQIDSSNGLVVSTGYDRGLLADLSLNFRALYLEGVSSLKEEVAGDTSGRCFVSYHKGLILRIDGDGTNQVHNPATKEKFVLPESPTVKKYADIPIEKTGLIVRCHADDMNHGCQFMVLRVYRFSKRIDIYYSKTHHWLLSSKFDIDGTLFEVPWYFDTHVALVRDKTLHVLFLTGCDRGLAIKVISSNNPETRVDAFRLPEAVEGGDRNARLGVCRRHLHLSYYKEGEGVWIWKNEFMNGEPTFDVWVPLLEISTGRQLCKQVAREHIAKPFVAGEFVAPFVFHPIKSAVVFFCIKSAIFAYDFRKDTIDKICEMDPRTFENPGFRVFPYSPCLNSFDALDGKPYAER